LYMRSCGRPDQLPRRYDGLLNEGFFMKLPIKTCPVTLKKKERQREEVGEKKNQEEVFSQASL
jgi:hypothetical protein